MSHSTSPTVAQMVLDDPTCARVFQRHRIDFCCAGHQTLEAACVGRGLEVALVRAELEAAKAERAAGSSDDPRQLSTRALLARIVGRHHGYLRQTFPAVRPLAAKVARVHGSREPHLLGLAAAVEELAQTLTAHMDDEERALFPALAEGRDMTAELLQMLEEHRAVAVVLDRIHEASGGFQPPTWACASYRALSSQLSELDADVREHIHLENHVLLPRVLKSAAG